MNGLTNGPSPSTQLASALVLVRAVLSELQALLPQAQASGSTSVGEMQFRIWMAALATAENLVRRLPVILIFPPPEYARLAGEAADQIARARAILSMVPLAQLTILPAPPPRANLSLQMLQVLISTLQEAERLIVQALADL